MSTEITKGRFIAAMIVAAISDAVSVAAEFVMPVQWVVDGVTAITLFAILGWRWQLLPAIAAEAIPGVAAFPSWVVVVIAIRMSNKAPAQAANPASIPNPDAPRKHVANEAQG